MPMHPYGKCVHLGHGSLMSDFSIWTARPTSEQKCGRAQTESWEGERPGGITWTPYPNSDPVPDITAYQQNVFFARSPKKHFSLGPKLVMVWSTKYFIEPSTHLSSPLRKVVPILLSQGSSESLDSPGGWQTSSAKGQVAHILGLQVFVASI